MAAQSTNQAVNSNSTVPEHTNSSYAPITPEQRLDWYMLSTAGLQSLAIAGPISAGWGTALDRPHEYGPHWEGFAKRYGVRLSGVAIGNGLEAGLGSIWGEDPRYFRDPHQPLKQRVQNVVDLTFRAYRSDGARHFAYARLLGNAGNNFMSNAWRPPSENDAQSAMWRIVTGIGARAASNAAQEFVPDLYQMFRRRIYAKQHR